MSIPKPPVAKKAPKELTIHNHTRIDNYYWLNQRENQEVIDYLNAENDYTNKILEDTEELQKTIFDEIVGRIKKTDMSVPYFKNGYYYYSRYEDKKEYAIHCRKKEHMDAEEEIILDVNELAKGHSYYQLGSFSISPDNKLVAFSADTVSRRIYTIYFKNLETKEIYAETIENTTGGAVWAENSKTIFYNVKDAQTLRSYQVYRYQLGDINSKTLIYEEEDETFSAYVSKSRSQKYIIISSHATLSDEYRVLPANNPMGNFELFHPRERNLEYSIGHHNNHFYIRTNDKAKNFRLMKTPVNNTGKKSWEEILPHQKNTFIEDFILFNKYLIVHQRVEGNQQMLVVPFEREENHLIDFGNEPFSVWFSKNPEFDTETLRLGYTSMRIPSSIYDYNIKTKELSLLKQQEVLGGYQAEEYTSKRTFATAQDGNKIPVTLVFKKDTPIDGSSPLLLYGYGSYGITVDPYFSISRLSLLDRGFIFAIAHIRGSQMLGRGWYDDGKMLKKKNTFNDFISCAEFLIQNNYTSSDKLMAMGGSAGGLLMGAVINLRPDLFKGVVASVPFVDVVTTMLDESIPLTTGEYDEWGNPNQKEYYDYILSYSPYDNIEAKNYPNMLVTTGLHDSQVQYWEPAKWVAKLRELKTGDNLLLMHTNMETGHSGASGRFEPYKEVALEYAFLLNLIRK